jgi:V8-like Glu-specific endopeptidase
MKKLYQWVVIMCCIVLNMSYVDAASPIIQQVADQASSAVVLIGLLDENDNLKSSGSGFIIDSDGWILTNDHVIEDAFAIDMNTEKEVQIAQIVVETETALYQDVKAVIRVEKERGDIALLKIPVSELPCLRLGNSDRVQKGDEVVAIGNPRGIQGIGSKILEKAYSSGEITYIDDGLLRTGADIFHGNSGGPLMNIYGEVIGIITLGGAGETFNVAYPINLAHLILNEVRSAPGIDDEIMCPAPFVKRYLRRDEKDGQFKDFTDGATLYSGERFKLAFIPSHESYVYIFQVSTSGQIIQLFPLDTAEGELVNPVQAGTFYLVPGKDASFELDEEIGVERVYVLVSSHHNNETEQHYQAYQERIVLEAKKPASDDRSSRVTRDPVTVYSTFDDYLTKIGDSQPALLRYLQGVCQERIQSPNSVPLQKVADSSSIECMDILTFRHK